MSREGLSDSSAGTPPVGTYLGGEQYRPSLGDTGDKPLRDVFDAAMKRTIGNLKRPLTQDMYDVLRSAEVLIWSYVSTMDNLSTRA